MAKNTSEIKLDDRDPVNYVNLWRPDGEPCRTQSKYLRAYLDRGYTKKPPKETAEQKRKNAKK
jgi:hypothetical protein